MTAPVTPAPAPAAPAPATSAPVAPAAPAGPKKATDILSGSTDELLQRFGLSDMAKGEEASEPEAPPAVVAATKVADAAAVPEATDDAAPEAEAPEVEAPKPDAPPRQLATQFKVFDGEGEIEVPDIQVTFTANGKERKEPLDKVVRLAQTGVYNEEREQTVKQQREQATVALSENQQLKAYVEALRKDVHALFSDETGKTYETYKAAFAQQNTPEARAERAERALAEERQKGQTQQATQQAQVFASALQQHMTQLTEQHPEVPFHEILGRFSELTTPYMQAGRVPPQAFPIVAQLVDQELTPWVQHTHQTRSEQKASAQRTADEKITRERQAATTARVLAKRQVARAVPGTANSTPTPLREQPKPPTYKKATDILGDVGRLVTQSG